MRRTIVVNLLVLGLLVLAVEAVGQAYFQWAHGVSLAEYSTQYLEAAHASSVVFERHPYLVARLRSNVRLAQDGVTVTTTAFHTRVTGLTSPPPGAIGVAVVGGSTTFGTRVTDADSWPWLLQEALGDGYAVVNYGVPGYTTAENIIQMALLVPERQPRIVVFYEGWNDLRNYHWPGFTADYYGHGMTQFDTLLPTAVDRAPFLTRAARHSFVMSLVNRALGTPVGAAAAGPSGANDPEVDGVYERNLQTLKALARRFDMTALFVPQVLNEPNYSKTGVSRSWTPYIEDASLPALMRGFNGLMARVCAPDETGCQFVAEPLSETWDGNDFVDEGHLSRRGGEKLAAIVASRIRRLR